MICRRHDVILGLLLLKYFQHCVGINYKFANKKKENSTKQTTYMNMFLIL